METDQWYRHYVDKIPQLSDKNRRIVEYLTGRIPLLLRALFDGAQFDEASFMNHKDLLKVKEDVLRFFEGKHTELTNLPHRMNT
jgi:hypothetical protein